MKPRADLGRKINAARRRAGFTVAELAGQLGVSRGLISDIVAGKRGPTPAIALRLVEMLDFDQETKRDLRDIDESTYTSSALDETMRLDRYEKTEG